MKEIVLKLDDQAAIRLESDIKARRVKGMSSALCDVLLIRLLEALSNNTGVLLVKVKDKNTIIRTYDNNRQVGSSDGKAIGENS